MPLPPSLSPDQRQAALDKAAAARRRRAELREKLKMGSTSLKELLEEADRDEVVGKMKVVTLLESLPGVGKVRPADSWRRSASAKAGGYGGSGASSARRCSRRSRSPA